MSLNTEESAPGQVIEYAIRFHKHGVSDFLLSFNYQMSSVKKGGAIQ
jgi:hypothetical protein